MIISVSDLCWRVTVMQWIDGVLSRGDKAEFFHDEFRCPVYVKDVVTIIQALTSRWISGNKSLVFAVTTFDLSSG